jgi:hypothetical protein
MSKPIPTESDAATPAMLKDNLLPFSFPAVERQGSSIAGSRVFETLPAGDKLIQDGLPRGVSNASG